MSWSPCYAMFVQRSSKLESEDGGGWMRMESSQMRLESELREREEKKKKFQFKLIEG